MSSLNHMLTKLDNSFSHSGTFQKRKYTSKCDLISLPKYEYLSSNNDYTHCNANTNRLKKQSQSYTKAKEIGIETQNHYSLLKNELTVSQDKFKSEINRILQLVISNKELTDKSIDDRLDNLNKEINDLKQNILEAGSEKKGLINQWELKEKNRNNKTEEKEESNSHMMVYTDTCRSQASLSPLNLKEKMNEMNYRITRNNQNIKALNQNIKTIMGHIKQNTLKIDDLNTALNQTKEDNDIKSAKTLKEIVDIKLEYEIFKRTLSSYLNQIKASLSNGLETFDIFHQEQNKLNDIYAKTIQELYNAFDQEKIENKKSNQIVEDKLNLINPSLDKIKTLADLEQDIPFLVELRKLMKENGHCCWSQLNSSLSHENIDLQFNKGTSKEKNNAEMNQTTDLFTRNTFMEDSIVTASPTIHHQTTSLIVDSLNMRYQDQSRHSFNIKYYQSGCISSDNSKCCSVETKNIQSEEFNLDKTSLKMKNRKILSANNNIAISCKYNNDKEENDSEKIIKKKRIIDMIKKENLIKKKRCFEINED